MKFHIGTIFSLLTGNQSLAPEVWPPADIPLHPEMRKILGVLAPDVNLDGVTGSPTPAAVTLARDLAVERLLAQHTRLCGFDTEADLEPTSSRNEFYNGLARKFGGMELEVETPSGVSAPASRVYEIPASLVTNAGGRRIPVNGEVFSSAAQTADGAGITEIKNYEPPLNARRIPINEGPAATVPLAGPTGAPKRPVL